MRDVCLHHAVAWRFQSSVQTLRPLLRIRPASLIALFRLSVFIGLCSVIPLFSSNALHAQEGGCLLLSELMILPIGDRPLEGKWVEVVNTCNHAVDLHGWALSTETRVDVVQTKLLIQPGQYILLGANNDPDMNYNVQLHYVLSPLHLPYKHGELRLLKPDGSIADMVKWSTEDGSAPPVGHSLERSGLSHDAPWQFCTSQWPKSKGNYGSPSRAYGSAVIDPAPTQTWTPTAISDNNEPTLSPPATATPIPSTIPRILISEIMADPAAVHDEHGEWLELFNGDATAVNLLGWALSDYDQDHHQISTDLWIQPGEYLVLGRNADAPANGGVLVRYVYDSLTLANESDELCLFTPWGALADQLVWGDTTPLRIASGSSLERAQMWSETAWERAQTPWPGSHGDCGSPGAPYVPQPTPTPAPTLATAWSLSNNASPLVIEEVFADGQEEEFIALLNRSTSTVDLTGWAVGDAEIPDDGEGVYSLPANYSLAPSQLFIIAHNAQAFTARWGFAPHAEFEESNDVHTLARLPGMATGTFALNDNGDEVILWDPAMHVADALVYGDAETWVLQQSGRLPKLHGESYQYDNSVQWRLSDDLRNRYMIAAPNPGQILALPAPIPRENPSLGDGLYAAWGSLGTHSSFIAGETRSPHYLAALSSSEGYDFLAVVDDGTVHSSDSVRPSAELILLPAWQWPAGVAAQSVVYSEQYANPANWDGFRSWLEANHATAQSRTDEPPAIAQLAAHAADDIHAHDYRALLRAWRSNRRPMLPAGNATPGRDGYAGQLYTGLAVRSVDDTGVMEALANRRGWASTSLGAWLTVRTDTGDWMGETISHCGETTFRVQYGDLSQEAAGLTLWRNDEAVHQLDAASSGQTWTVSVDTRPGDFIYASATQFDGDFAVSSPILVSYSATGCEIESNSFVPPPAAVSPSELEDDDDERLRDTIAVLIEQGQEDGDFGSLARAKLMGLNKNVEFRAQVIAPPGLYNAAIYVAEPAEADPTVAGLGMQVYLRSGDFTELAEGDWVLVKGQLHSYRGELEVLADASHQVWRIGEGAPIQPLPISAADVGESLEGRLVTFTGEVTGWRGDSFFLCDPRYPEKEVKVTVRSSLDWKRPYVNAGEVWQVTGIVSQFGTAHPWNDGYRVLARYESDLVKLTDP